MKKILEDLVAMLRLERLEVNLFRGESRDIGSPQVFGGQVLGQALRDDLEAVHQADAAHDQDKDKGQRPQVGPQTQGCEGGEEAGDHEKAPVAL